MIENRNRRSLLTYVGSLAWGNWLQYIHHSYRYEKYLSDLGLTIRKDKMIWLWCYVLRTSTD